MYLAYKHAKKKRQAAEAAAAAAATGQTPTPGAPQPEHGALIDGAHPSAGPQPEAKETPEERAEKKRRRSYRWKIILGLFLPFTLQALDTTIIASAVVFIADDFSKCYP